MKVVTAVLLVLTLNTCKTTGPAKGIVVTDKPAISYLALGDSYTSGESVARNESFPYVLISRLRANGFKTLEPKVVAVTGWTTTELMRGITQVKLDDQYDVVTVLIGVNNQYRGLSVEGYRKDFRKILDIAIRKSKKGRRGVFVLSIPDWTLTPFGKLNHQANAVTVSEFNAVNKEESLAANVHYVDITSISILADTDPSMTSSDDLHPSPRMYSEWVKKLYPSVIKEIQ